MRLLKLCQDLALAVGYNCHRTRCFSSDTVSVWSELPETNPSLFYCVDILLGHGCLDELCLHPQRMEDGRGSQSGSARHAHCFLVPQLTSQCPHIPAGEPARSQQENEKPYGLIAGQLHTLNRVIYYRFISKTCC